MRSFVLLTFYLIIITLLSFYFTQVTGLTISILFFFTLDLLESIYDRDDEGYVTVSHVPPGHPLPLRTRDLSVCPRLH